MSMDPNNLRCKQALSLIIPAKINLVRFIFVVHHIFVKRPKMI